MHILHYIHVECKWLEAMITYIKAKFLMIHVFRRDYPKYPKDNNAVLLRIDFLIAYILSRITVILIPKSMQLVKYHKRKYKKSIF